MKIAFIISALTISLLAAGCSQPAQPSPSQPLATGTAISGMIWKYPRTAASNEGSGIPQDARVDVYDRLIIIHLADGSRQVVQLDLVTDLKLK